MGESKGIIRNEWRKQRQEKHSTLETNQGKAFSRRAACHCCKGVLVLQGKQGAGKGSGEGQPLAGLLQNRMDSQERAMTLCFSI